jgi:hypothetical protein
VLQSTVCVTVKLVSSVHRTDDAHHRVPTNTPPSSTRGKAGRNHLNEEINPLLPTRIGERIAIQPNHIKFRTCSALAPM